MNCPHCATPNATSPTCRLCCLPTDAPASDTPMPGLITNEQVLGDTRIPEEPAPAVAPSARCRRCGADAGPGRFCERCGMALWPVGTETAPAEAPALRCLACGVPNDPRRPLCVACGQRL